MNMGGSKPNYLQLHLKVIEKWQGVEVVSSMSGKREKFGPKIFKNYIGLHKIE